LTVPWSTICWQPSRKTVTERMARAACIFAASSWQLSSSFASRGSVGPAPTALVSLRAMLLLPCGIRLRPPISCAMLLMARAASRRTGTCSCIRSCVAAETTSEAMAWHLLSWCEQRSQMVRRASMSFSGAMVGDFSCSTRRGKRRSPKAMLTSSSFK